MPGILPMKVIKVGTSSQTRIAQACDRCRSKKIRCDGIRPSCTQCVNVGFECKTSDKLSRRAFPRGYTESLEERVRALEAEVRELKDLLDEKDEKIDMLSRIHSHSPQPIHTSPRSSPSSAALSAVSSNDSHPDKDDLFKVTQSPILLETDASDAYFVGTSSGRTLVDAFKNRAQATGKGSIDVRADEFFSNKATSASAQPLEWRAPSRLLSDQLINIFFQEWAPVFPILHRPTFLHLYEEYVAAPEAMQDKQSLAQLHLVFGIAGQSSNARDEAELAFIERQWKAALDSFLLKDSLKTLQCLTLAQIYCLLAGDQSGLSKYKGLAVSLSYRLGLHQSQKRFALGTLTSETRKKVFWTLFTLDCFSAAQLGSPRLMKEDDIHCEYPVDADDDYVTEKGFLPTLPGESTKISSALALFRMTRILAKVLENLYPASPTYDISFKTLTTLSDELDGCFESLPSHLKLQFVQDKPSTNVVNSRSPLLSLAYFYIRSLIHRPVVCASTTLGDRASSSVGAVATSAKCTIQIIQLLEERNLCFAFCLNRNELLIASGFGLLFQTLDLDRDGKLIMDNQRMLAAVVDLTERSKATGARHFRKIASAILTPVFQQPPILSRRNSENVPAAAAAQEVLQTAQKHLVAIAARRSPERSYHREGQGSNEGRRATVPIIGASHPNVSQTSLASVRSEPSTQASNGDSSPSMPTSSPSLQRSSSSMPKRTGGTARIPTNLDYLPFNPNVASRTTAHANTNASAAEARQRGSLPHLNTAASAQSARSAPAKGVPEIADADWERMIGSLDQADTNIYDTIYGGPTADALSGVDLTSLPLTMPLSASAIEAHQSLVWDAQHGATNGTHNGNPGPNYWRNSSYGGLNTSGPLESYGLLTSPAPVPSVLSFSDESLSSGEEFGSVNSNNGRRITSGNASDEVEMFRGMVIPADMENVSPALYASGMDNESSMGGLDAGFGL